MPTAGAAAVEAAKAAAAISAALPPVRPRQREPETVGPAAEVRRGRRAEEEEVVAAAVVPVPVPLFALF